MTARWLSITALALIAQVGWIGTGLFIGLDRLIIGHVAGVIAAAGATVACGGKLWSA